MAVFAKAISNGYPMGAVVGRRWVMEPASRMFISSLYWSDTIGLAAALTTIRELRRRNGLAHLHHITRLLQDRLNEALAETGLDGQCVGTTAHLGLRFNLDDPLAQKQAATIFIQEMAKRGVIMTTGIFVSCAHSEEDVEVSVAAAQEAFTLIQAGLAQNRLEELLEAEVQTDLFRRLVR